MSKLFGQSSKQAENAEIYLNLIVSSFKAIFSIFILTPICIASTGVFLGYVFNLEDGTDFLNIPIYKVLGIKVTGRKVVAGFTLFIMSLFLVGLLFSNIAKKVFVENIQITSSQLEACLLMSGVVALFVSVLLSAVYMTTLSVAVQLKFITNNYYLRSPIQRKTPEERVQALIGEEQKTVQPKPLKKNQKIR